MRGKTVVPRRVETHSGDQLKGPQFDKGGEECSCSTRLEEIDLYTGP